ncbi:tyrosine-protein kinase family protein [Mucilaginibacter sp.]|uniref:GumC family protein n=1 Tax=Mucilaginibacter sp. TaxID=1882438 RepID=UPI00260AF7B1|nr:tyrosine-protein kinase family protein [Mucilaginibacter sp.]MDB4926949.1 polysaccharide biosynthesis proteinregulator [Mucilaginibacter sp.]
MEELNKVTPKLPNQEFDYYKIAKILLSRWYWIAGSVLICFLASNVYLWYTPKVFATSAVIKFEEKKSEISDMVGMATSTDRANVSKIQSETIILQSTPLLLNAVKHLDYRMSFYVVGRVLNRTNELYPAKPLDVQLINFDTLNFFHNLITFKPINKTSFNISYQGQQSILGKDITQVCYYNVPFTVGPTSFSIKYPADLPKTASFLFKLNAPEDFIGRIRGGLHTQETAKNSNMLSLQQTDSNPRFAADALNAVVQEYMHYDHSQRTKSALQMIRFIDDQLNFLATKLNGSESSIQEYKQNNKIIDVSSASDRVIGRAKELESQISIIKLDLLAIDQLQQDIVKGKDNVNINLNTVGASTNTQIGEFVANLNSLLSLKTALLKTYNNNSPQIQDIDRQILQIKNTTINSIVSSRKLIETKLKYEQDQLVPVNQQIAQLPAAERQMVSLKRDFEVNDKVYSFLSEKKLDQEILTAGILPGATIIDLAQPNYNPVSPDDHSFHRTAIILGIAIGLGFIILIRVLNPYIYDKETVENITTIPIIGVIRKFPEDIDEFSTQILAISKPKSIFAESVRSVRTNLNFLASEKKSKVICVTSEVAGEGKSFVAVNLSSTLSLIDKKVILIAADLRRSKLHKTFHVPNDMGLSNYLANRCSIDDIINNSNQEGLDFIVSGPVPPNPSELLHSARMTELINNLKERYDIIMIDTAPIGLVSDAIPLIRMSDINLFVIRSGKSKFYAATIPQRIAQEYHLDNTVIVLNAFAQDQLHSGYYSTKYTGNNYGATYYYYSDYAGNEGSGYYIDDNENKWWHIWNWFKK